jgi:hypothetical protein
MWRTLRVDPAAVPAPGFRQESAGAGIDISVTQQCQLVLPPTALSADEVTVTVTSGRAGATGKVSVGANFNSTDGSYQGPTHPVGSGQFTASNPVVQVRFVVLDPGFPILGVGAQAEWDDGTPVSYALTYAQLHCRLPIWWRWLIRAITFLIEAIRGGISSFRPRD